MAVPKRKMSKARRDSRRANWKLTAPGLVECPQCHEQMRPHHVCPECGYYMVRKSSRPKRNKTSRKKGYRFWAVAFFPFQPDPGAQEESLPILECLLYRIFIGFLLSAGSFGVEQCL